MNGSTRPLSSRGRDAAIRRLRSLTLGSAVAGTLATGGFATLAAFNYAGHPAIPDPQGAAGSGGAADALPGWNGQVVGPDQAGTVTSPGAGTAGQPYAVVAAPSTHHHAHVSTGGSG